MGMTRAEGQGHSVQTLEWKQTDGRTEAIALHRVLMWSVRKDWLRRVSQK